ncbi:phage tail tape measure protein [Rhodocyclus gracilis]|uniref:Phage tail tape measure protein n=1 Tax=Rhodocyclus tenuis TaxID=1066 RepID=A0A6L5JT23_RHOTE|nr:phage tail tape measure protein [Rhodocyclus gracilis]MQY50181.1 phage tail tape measure protein [Rhodocyclus gracilis]
MSNSMIMMGVTIKLFDQMSGGMRGIGQQVDGLRDKFKQMGSAGRNAMATGFLAGGTLMKSVSAFSDLEDASMRLKVTMTDRDGLTGAFEKVNALAIKLGNLLPGTSADFLNMMAALKAQGITDDSILGGVGEAAARMAVLLKKTPEEMGVFAAKLKTALGVADSDMLKFMDTIQRTYFQGVDATEMMYAFARSGGALKTLGQQGLAAGKALAPLYALWVKGGLSGETVGTGFASISASLLDRSKVGKANALLSAHNMPTLKFTDKKGNFLGIENMVKEFDKLKGLSAERLNAVLKEIFGGGQDQQMIATLVKEGVDGYQKMVEAMDKQASLQKRTDMQLGTLKNLWDAASGTFTNTIAGFSGAMGDDLKNLADWFGKLSEAVGTWITQNPVLAQWLGRIALAFTGLAIGGGVAALALAGVGAAVGGLATVLLGVGGALASALTIVSAFGVFMLANPIVPAALLIGAAAGIIIDNWAPIKAFFVDLWEGVKNSFAGAIDWISSKMQTLANLLPGSGKGSSDWKLGDARPSAITPGGQDATVGGEIRVRVDQDGRVSSVAASTSNPRVPLNVDAGRTMVTP